MSIRQLAQGFARIDTGFRCAERHVGEELDETMPGVRHLDPDSACLVFRHYVDGGPEAAGKIAYQMENEIASTDQREIDGHSAQVYSQMWGDPIYLHSGPPEADKVYVTYHDGGDTEILAESVSEMLEVLRQRSRT